MQNKNTQEADARIIIDRKLREAGWNIEDKSQISTEVQTKGGLADYLLRDRRSRSIALIEAKRFSIDPVSAKQQALDYAEELKVDFIFLSNGDDIYFWDFKRRPEQKVSTFFSQKDLEKIKSLRVQEKPISSISIPTRYFKGGEERDLRPYHQEAMRVMDRALESKKRKMLMVMATGAGKTDLTGLYMKRLFEAGLIERALFLVDRIELGRQAQECFNDVLKDYSSNLLFGGKKKTEDQIIISTLPTIYSQLNSFTSGYFDLIVSDEAHRSIYGVYNAVLSHFDAIRIGLTATPSMFIDRNTYKLFDCWSEKEQKGIPTFKYGIRRGIKEGYLAGYDIVRIDTKVSLRGITYQGEDYDPDDLERVINVPARNKQIARSFREEEEKISPDRFRKTLIFAVTKKHASQLSYYLNEAYSEWNGRYAEVITTDTRDPKRAIDRFKKEDLPFTAVSVGMLDAGFDCPWVENIVMVRPTKSPILYQQMRGRGSRLCKEIKKRSFRIYDFVGVTRHFNDESYNPYSDIEKVKKGIPWGTEEEELTEIEKEAIKKRLFVQIPEEAAENIDEILKREHVEVGPEGERIDIDDYQYAWKKEIENLKDKELLIQKISENKEISDKEIENLSEKINVPKYFFNEVNLREAYHYPAGTLPEFIKKALGIYELPTPEQLRENRVNRLFESWLVDKSLNVEQAKTLRMLKNQYLSDKEKVTASVFNQPLFNQFGGLRHVIRIFGEKEIQTTLDELNTRIFIE